MATEPRDPLFSFEKTYSVKRDFDRMPFVPHRFGRIYTCSTGSFVVILEGGHPKITAKLIEAGGEMRSLADDNKQVVFPFEKFATVAEIVKARRKKQVTEQTRKHLASIGYQRAKRSLIM